MLDESIIWRDMDQEALRATDIHDYLKSLCPDSYIIRGEYDEDACYPETKTLAIGQFKLGICHGHQIALYDSFLEKVLREHPGLPCFLFGILQALLNPKVDACIEGVVLTSPANRVQLSHPIIEEKMSIQDETGTQGLTLTQDEVVEKVLKHRSSYVQGLGVYARPTTSSRSTTTSITFETEARLRAEMTEMRES